MDSCGAVLAVAEVAVAEVVGNEAVLVAESLTCMRDMVLAELNPVDSAVEAPYARNAAAAAALMEAPVSLERLPVHSIHSVHDHDRWLRGFVLASTVSHEVLLKYK